MSTTITGTDMDALCINTIRGLCMDAVQQANSGHPGTPMGVAPVAYHCGRGSSASIHPTRSGRTGTGSCCPRATRPPSCGPCCT